MATKRGYLGRSVDSWGSVLGSWPGYFVRCRLIYQQRDRQKKNPVKSLRAGTRPSTAGSPGGAWVGRLIRTQGKVRAAPAGPV